MSSTTAYIEKLFPICVCGDVLTHICIGCCGVATIPAAVFSVASVYICCPVFDHNYTLTEMVCGCKCFALGHDDRGTVIHLCSGDPNTDLTMSRF